MTRVLIAITLSFFSLCTFGQKKEVNPNIDTEWRFIKSQELNMTSGSFYSYEFPAEKKYDYIFNLTHNKSDVFLTITIFDMQDMEIKKTVVNSSNLSSDLFFTVEASGTYKVVVGITDPKGKKGDVLPSQFSLIRRIQF